jgi:hypothetical protein
VCCAVPVLGCTRGSRSCYKSYSLFKQEGMVQLVQKGKHCAGSSGGNGWNGVLWACAPITVNGAHGQSHYDNQNLQGKGCGRFYPPTHPPTHTHTGKGKLTRPLGRLPAPPAFPAPTSPCPR